MLEAPRELVHDQAFNVGRAEDNVQVRDIADMVREAVPGSSVTLADNAGPDLRDYRVDFSKLTGTFPELTLRWRVRDGVSELVDSFASHGLTYEDFVSSRTRVRLRRIKELLSAGVVRQNAQAGELTARVRARAKIASSISPVTRPVNVFCWLGW